MNLRLLFGGIVLGAGAALICTQAISQDHGHDHDHDHGHAHDHDAPAPPEIDMEAFIRSTTPGEPHERLARLAGTWDTTLRMYWGGPDAPAIENQGVSTMTSVLDGRFLLERHEWKMSWPDESGAMQLIDASGIGLSGYDNNRKAYVSSWADSVNTHLLKTQGVADPSGRVITSYGEMDEPMLGLIGRMLKHRMTIKSDDLILLEVYDLAAGDDYKAFDITYRRRQ